MEKALDKVTVDVITLAINYRWNVRLTDSQNGFRAIALKAARTLELTEDIFAIEQEMIMECLRRGYRVAEVPAHEYRRSGGEVVGNGRAPVAEELDVLPFPAWDLIDPHLP